MKISIFGETNVGKRRDHNEDCFLILKEANREWEEINDTEIELNNSEGLFIAVADGMGGANAGEIASSIAIESVKYFLQKTKKFPTEPKSVKTFLESILLQSHKNIVNEATSDFTKAGMGTTLILAWVHNHTLSVVWSGDSRCYVYNKKNEHILRPFTDDHSLVWEKVKSGILTPEQARLSDQSNIIMQALGDLKYRPKPDFRQISLKKNTRLILCSDGLNSMLSDSNIETILKNEGTKETCKELIKQANNAGGHDNITTIVTDIVDLKKNKLTINNKSKKTIGYLLLSVSILFSLFFYILFNNLA